MTDDEAIRYGYRVLAKARHGGELEAFVRHALQALADRAMLSEWSVTSAPELDLQVSASRRHMRGEE